MATLCCLPFVLVINVSHAVRVFLLWKLWRLSLYYIGLIIDNLTLLLRIIFRKNAPVLKRY